MNGHTHGIVGPESSAASPWVICVYVNHPEKKCKPNFFKRHILSQRGDEDKACKYKVYFYDPIEKRAFKETNIVLNPIPVR